MDSKKQDFDQEEILELTNRILDDGTIVNLKEEREKNRISKSERLSIGVSTNLDENDFQEEEGEDDDGYQAYLRYRQANGNLNLKSHIKKVNVPEINNDVSVFTHENNLLIQALVLAIIIFVKPLFRMDINLPKDQEESNILINIKNYINEVLPKIKQEVISRYMNGRSKKVEIKFELDERISANSNAFNDLLINNFLIWAKNSFDTSQFSSDDSLSMEIRLGNYIDDFVSREMDGIFARIKC